MEESFIFKVNAVGKDMASARLISPPIITLWRLQENVIMYIFTLLVTALQFTSAVFHRRTVRATLIFTRQ